MSNTDITSARQDALEYTSMAGETAKKVERILGALTRIIPNINGPNSKKGKLHAL